MLAVFQDDGVFTDQINPADMAIEINPDEGPVKPRGDLFDMG